MIVRPPVSPASTHRDGEPRAAPQRIFALDALRGLAALAVVMSHCLGAVDITAVQEKALRRSVLAPIFHGNGSVDLFFVLSGFVLTRSLIRRRGGAATLAYCLRRVLRIHPPYVLAVLLAWVVSLSISDPGGSHGVSRWLRYYINVHVGPSAVLESLWFPGIAHNLLPVGWTLYVEMIVSLTLPAMAWAMRRSHWSLIVAAAACLPYLGLTSQLCLHTVAFSAGAAAFLERERWHAPLAGARRVTRTGFLLIAFVVFLLPLFSPLDDWHPLHVLGYTLGSLGIIACVESSNSLRRVLSFGPLLRLGRNSYSLYLLHFPLLVLLASTAPRPDSPMAGGIALALMVVAATVVAAEISYLVVERTSIAYGERVSAWLIRASGAAAAFPAGKAR